MTTNAQLFVDQTKSAVPTTSGGNAIPTGSAYMLTGTWIYNGVSYDCSQEGLYRFFDDSNGTYSNQ